MHCPVCNSPDTRVVDSRLAPDGTSVRRRRQCDACEYRFSTSEEVELLDITVVKRDGHRETYNREKIERGLRRALEKRSHTDAEFRQLMHAIEREIHRRKTPELRSDEIGEIVMEELKTFDKVAYIRFASVYRSFEDVKTFRDELSDLLKQTKQRARKKNQEASEEASS